MPTKLDVSLLSDLEEKCLKGIIHHYFSENIAAASYDQISKSFFRDAYYATSPISFDLEKAPEVEVAKGTPFAKMKKVSDFPIPLLRKTVDKLVNSGYLTAFSDNNDTEYEFSSDFADLAYELHLQSNVLSKRSQKDEEIPASDRFVSPEDNSPLRSETLNSLEKLSEAIKGANDLFANADQRLQISREVDFIREIVSAPKIHVIAVWENVKHNRTLKWLMEQTISGVVRTAAGNAFGHLEKLLQALFPH